MTDEFKINMKRDDIGNCKGCGEDSSGVVFKGRANECCTHMHSEDGWWLRLSHHFDYTMEGRERLPDTVGELLCPKCCKEHDKRMAEFIGDLG